MGTTGGKPSERKLPRSCSVSSVVLAERAAVSSRAGREDPREQASKQEYAM